MIWIARAFGICFGGVGLTVLAFMWGSPWHEFHSPPLFFRVFATFIALPFVAFGGAMLFAKPMDPLKKVQELSDSLPPDHSNSSAPPQPGKLKCPNCGSSPGTAEVSPHGDVKCDHCARWYNVHTA